MLHYLSNEFMLDTLKKVQHIQIQLLQAGVSAHLDASVNNNHFGEPGTHISFGIDIFVDNTLEESFDFSSNTSVEEIEAELASLKAYINNRL